MDADLYTTIIYNYLVPFWPKNNRYAFIYQDNDTKHAAKQSTQALANANIKWVN